MRRTCLCLLACAATVAEAQESVYVGLGFGQYDYEEQFDDPILGQVSDSVDSYKLFGGFELNDYFAIEVSYGKDDNIEQSGSGNFVGFGDVFYQVDIEYKKTAVRAVGMLPFESVVLLGGIGYFSAEADFSEFIATELQGSATGGGTINDDGLMAQLGVEWRFGRFGTRYGIRLEYEWWDQSDVDASTIGLALSYGF